MFTRFRQLKIIILIFAIVVLLTSYLYAFTGEIQAAVSLEIDNASELAIQDFYYEDYHDSTGIMYQKSSEFFDFKIEPVTICKTDEGYSINYQLSVFNKSDRDFDNAHLVFGLDDQMGQYLASGIVEYPGARTNLRSMVSSAKNEKEPFSHSLNASFQLSLTEDLDQLPLENVYAALENAKKIDVSVYWDKGAESHSFITRME